jgi:hypothetical protein
VPIAELCLFSGIRVIFWNIVAGRAAAGSGFSPISTPDRIAASGMFLD